MKKIITKSESETRKLGERLAKKFKGGEIVCLEGELGTGKTTLIKGIAKGLGIKRHITSPTFVLMKIYKTNPHESVHKYHESRIRTLCHVDVYRINQPQELVDIGILEYLASPRVVTVIEWAEKVKKILPNDTIWIKMGHGERENEREIIINPSTPLRSAQDTRVK